MKPYRVAPIILIHGLFGHLKDPLIRSAFGEQAVYAPDLIGYGDPRKQDVTNLQLRNQADHVARFISEKNLGQVNLVGHSVGGAIAVLIAESYPELAASLISVEGNFTLNDAFWSAQLAEKQDDEVENLIAGYRQNPESWIAGAGVPITDWVSGLARSWLANQSAATIKAQARAVVQATAAPSYLKTIEELMRSDLPVCLIAGERSADGWDVPVWAIERATQNIKVPG